MFKPTTISSSRSTIERIRPLETERKNLLLEIESLKPMDDAKAKALENEIIKLRDELSRCVFCLAGKMGAEFGKKETLDAY